MKWCAIALAIGDARWTGAPQGRVSRIGVRMPMPTGRALTGAGPGAGARGRLGRAVGAQTSLRISTPMNAPVASPLRPRPSKHSPGVGVSHPDSSLAHATPATTPTSAPMSAPRPALPRRLMRTWRHAMESVGSELVAPNCYCMDEDIVKAGGDSTHERQPAPINVASDASSTVPSICSVVISSSVARRLLLHDDRIVSRQRGDRRRGPRAKAAGRR